jgi:hypothetical protein
MFRDVGNQVRETAVVGHTRTGLLLSAHAAHKLTDDMCEGKTPWLSLVLVLRLSAKLRAILQLESEVPILFDDTGANILPCVGLGFKLREVLPAPDLMACRLKSRDVGRAENRGPGVDSRCGRRPAE